MNKIVSTNTVVAKALAMNEAWGDKSVWERESKIESTIKSKLGIVTDVGIDGKAVVVGVYDDKAKKSVDRIKKIVEEIEGRVVSQRFYNDGEDNVLFTVARNSRAMNAAGVKSGNYEVTLETVTFGGNSTVTKTMTDSQLKSWLTLIHNSGVYTEAINRLAKGEKYFDANLDMHPTVHIKPIQ